MALFHNILVPLDSSEYAKAALQYAVGLARASGGEILAVMVVQPLIPSTAFVTPMGGYANPYPEQMEAAEGYLAELQSLVAGVPCRTAIRTGDPATQIVAAAQEARVDVIIMATHGRSGLSRLLMGSTAEAVMRNATVPVLTLRPELLQSAAPKTAITLNELEHSVAALKSVL